MVDFGEWEGERADHEQRRVAGGTPLPAPAVKASAGRIRRAGKGRREGVSGESRASFGATPRRYHQLESMDSEGPFFRLGIAQNDSFLPSPDATLFPNVAPNGSARHSCGGTHGMGDKTGQASDFSDTSYDSNF